MYVAMTRAKKTVHLFSGSEWACSDFVKEIATDYPTNIKSFLKKTKTFGEQENKQSYSSSSTKTYKVCPTHKINLRVINGKFGKFYGCPSVIDGKYCSHTENITSEEGMCPFHHIKLSIRSGKFGKFYGCPGKTNGKFCSYTENIKDLDD